MKELIVIRNTYPHYPNVAYSQNGDIVNWQVGKRKFLLVRKADGKTVFSRDCRSKGVEDTRPMLGVIASVYSRGWYLEIGPKPEGWKE